MQNVALFGAATGTVETYGGVPSRIIDGNPNGNWAAGKQYVSGMQAQSLSGKNVFILHTELYLGCFQIFYPAGSTVHVNRGAAGIAWINVDFRYLATVNTVIIYHRLLCCIERNKDVQVIK